MKTKRTPAETLEFACRLAEMMKKRVEKIGRLTTLAVSAVENGEVLMAQPSLVLLACEAEGLGMDVRQIVSMLNELPAPANGGQHG